MTTVTGTGAVTFDKMIAAGSGTAPLIGTGAVTLKKMTTSGFGVVVGNYRISWDTGPRTYSQGIGNAVLYPKNSPGVAWNGLTSVTEKGDDSTNSLYVDGQLYRNRNVPSTFAGVISAYTYPDEFEPYIGANKGITGQPKKTFGLTYRDNLELHIVYNVVVLPSSDKYVTLGDTTSPVDFSWDFTTLPVNVPGGRPSSHVVVMLDYVHPAALSALEDILYGDDANTPSLPDPLSLFNLFDSYADLRITDNGDGTWTAVDTPGTIITMLDSVTFQIDYSTAIMINSDEYTVHSL